MQFVYELVNLKECVAVSVRVMNMFQQSRHTVFLCLHQVMKVWHGWYMYYECVYGYECVYTHERVYQVWHGWYMSTDFGLALFNADKLCDASYYCSICQRLLKVCK